MFVKVQETTRTKMSKIDRYICDKMKLLEDFTVVTEDNAVEIEKMLYKAVAASPWRHHEFVVDEVAKALIKAKLDEYEARGG